ncbi:MAG: glycosyltransferase [Verrucomicrobia bacterium]|nr:MAG: glycosyltransferase [Verrucomicrobiota bacterium]
MGSDKLHVAVVFHRLGPYHVARLTAAAKVMRITAIELSAETREYAWIKVNTEGQLNRVTLFPEADSRAANSREVAARMEKILGETKPDAVALPGWSDGGALAGLQWCRRNRVPAIVMSESTAWDEPRKPWKEFVKRRIVNQFSAALVGGSPHVDYLVELGMARERVFTGYDAVDNEYFAATTEEIRRQKAESRKQPGLPEKFFLASARFIEKKNLSRLIEAYALYREKVETRKAENRKQKAEAQSVDPSASVSTFNFQLSTLPWSLVLLGDGPLRETLNSQLSTLNLHDHVLLLGFKQYDELPAYYAHASAFIHASTTEQWGLVVNEAMASGLPVLVSNRCGCARDLVQEGVNGFTFDPTNVEQIAGLMLRFSTLNSQLSTFAATSRTIIANWGTEKFAIGLKSAAETALAASPRHANWSDRLLMHTLLAR